MKKTILVIVTVCLFGLSIFISGYTYYSKPKVAYVSVSSLYNEFSYKLEMETKLKNLQSNQQMALDSIKMEMKILSNGASRVEDIPKENLVELQQMQQVYYMKEKKFSEEYNSFSQEYNTQIIKQLNQYVIDYGKENGYDYIFGANSEGSIMYANEGDDVTKEVVEYINKRYNGNQE